MFYVRMSMAVLAFVATTVYGTVLALVRRDRSGISHAYARMLARLMLPAFGTRVLVQGEENLYARQPCVYLINHQSMMDVPVLATIFPTDTVVVAKKELRKIPLFGWLYEAIGNVFIDRANREQAVGRLKEAEDAIRARGVSVWIFPEGTRGKVQGELLPFKKGGFYMALETGVPLVPLVVGPLKELVDFRRRRIRPGTVEVRVLEPIPTEGLTEADLLPLMQEARTRMGATLDEMTARRTFLLPREKRREE